MRSFNSACKSVYLCMLAHLWFMLHVSIVEARNLSECYDPTVGVFNEEYEVHDR